MLMYNVVERSHVSHCLQDYSLILDLNVMRLFILVHHFFTRRMCQHKKITLAGGGGGG